MLGVDYERCARFEIVRSIGSVERPLAVTVTTTSASQTRALQRAWEKRSTVGVLVGLGAVSFRDPSEVVIDGMPGAATRLARPRPSPGAEPWRGFLHIEEKSERPPKPHPWTLVIVEVLYG